MYIWKKSFDMKLIIGDKAPEFFGPDQDNVKIHLNQFAGKKIVLYFYPKDSTPGCTAEACSLRDSYDHLLKAGYAVVGVSADSASSHKKFIEKYQLPFPLVADTDRSIQNAYGVYGEKKFMGKTYDGVLRKTYLIDKKGNIFKVYEKVNPLTHAEEIFNDVNTLQK
jgi:peroxiredoxin Q/BCP